MSSEPPWQLAARERLSGGRVLLVDSKGFSLPNSTEAADPFAAQRLDERFDGVLWQLRGALQVGIGLLKRRLAPGGRLLIWVEGPRASAALFKLLLARPAAPVCSLEEVCEALLGAGLLEPHVLDEGKRGFAVCATQPRALGMLDALFSQPGS